MVKGHSAPPHKCSVVLNTGVSMETGTSACGGRLLEVSVKVGHVTVGILLLTCTPSRPGAQLLARHSTQ